MRCCSCRRCEACLKVLMNTNTSSTPEDAVWREQETILTMHYQACFNTHSDLETLGSFPGLRSLKCTTVPEFTRYLLYFLLDDINIEKIESLHIQVVLSATCSTGCSPLVASLFAKPGTKAVVCLSIMMLNPVQSTTLFMCSQ